MPKLTRAFVKSSLACLVLALAGWALLPVSPSLAALRPAVLHLFVVGWLTQLVFGVALWMFPRPRGPEPPRAEALGWAVFACLDAGLALRVVAEPLSAQRPGPVTAAALVLSALLQLAAACGFTALAWGRVRARDER